MRRRVARQVAIAAVGAATLLASACTDASPGGAGATTGGTPVARATTPAPAPTPRAPLVVDTVFDHATLDPTRQFDRSGLLVSKAVYQTLTDLDATDPTKVVPGIAEYTLSPEGKWLTMRLRKGLVFSDGTPVTTDDVVFTLQRAQGLGGTAAAVLGTVNIVKVDDRTFTLSSPRSNFALPAVLANPAFGILNSAAVKANGGTVGPGDTAARYLSTHSAGSGPYVLTGATTNRVTLAANPAWTGASPAFGEVVLRDVAPKDQVGDVRAGRADVALDLSPAQAAALTASAMATSTPTSAGTGGPAASSSGTATPTGTATASGAASAGGPGSVAVTASDSSTLAFLSLSRNPRVNRWTANTAFVEAVRKGLDVEALARVAGDAHPAAGLVPSGIVGSLEDGAVPTVPPTPTRTGTPSSTGTPSPATSAPTTGSPGTGTPLPGSTSATGTFPPPTAVPTAPPRDLAGARAALRRSGYRGEPVRLTYAVDVPIAGIQRSTIANAVRGQLASVGIRVVLDPQPSSTALASYRSGRSAFSLWSWSPDYPDPENYLAFAPGELVGQRAGWQRGEDALVDELTEAARASVGDDRSGAYAAWQVAMNERGPFVPLLQPMNHIATGPRVHQVPANPVWTVDLAAVS
ncbi:ABC transporter substrate-binding protein [Intrasporangium flavum]|uniref:ABC transporter substrate-binding protein n=1 Tax=Intrasporangium flavum TaxID=1428657 RepID=UPI001A96B793|nr:ABC transporter substrate-binding protein [Intrasporangium flavum]